MRVPKPGQTTPIDSPLPMFIYDLQTLAFLEVNHAALSLYGYSREEFLALRLDAIRPDADGATAEVRPRRNMIWTGRVRHRRRDGNSLDVFITRHTFNYGTRRAGLAIIQPAPPLALDVATDFNDKVLQTLPHALYVIDREGRFVLCNPAGALIAGYPPEELIGQPYSILWDRGVLPGIDAIFARVVLYGETVFRYEAQLRRKDGHPRSICLNGAPLYDGDRIIGVIGTAEDITLARFSEGALRQIEQRYQTLMLAAPIGIFHTDANGRCLHVNERWASLTGLTWEQAKGDGWVAALHAADRERVRRAWQEACEKNIPFRAEYRFQRGTRTVWVLGQAIAETDANGEIVGYVGTITDITEQKRAEAEHGLIEDELRRSERRLRTIIDESPLSIQIFSADGSCVEANAAWEKLWGASRETLVGYNILRDTNLFGARHMPLVHKAFAGETVHIDGIRRNTPRAGDVDGSRWFEAFFYPVRDEQGRLADVALVLNDVTERWSAEAASAQLGRILDDSFNEIYVFDADTLQFMQVSQGALRNLGYSAAEIRALTPIDVKPMAREDFSALIQPLMDGEKDQLVFVTEHIRKDKSRYPVEIRLQPVAYGEQRMILAIVQDISERKQRETLLAGEKRVLEMIAKGAPLVEILKTVARLYEMQSAKTCFCAVMLLDKERNQLRLGAAPSLPEAFNRLVDGVAVGREVSCCSAAAYERKRIVSSDIEAHDRWTRFRELALAHGLRACSSAPIIGANGTVLGTFAMYYPEPREPSSEERALSERVLQLAGIAIEKQQAEAAIATIAYYDSLTGLANRDLLTDRLAQALVRSRRHGRLVSVLFVDIDRFKQVNDSLGHHAGDRLLKILGERMRKSVRDDDTVARFSADEFVVVLDDIARESDVAEVAQKILDAVNEPVIVDNHEVFVTASVGASIYPRDGETVEALLNSADTAVYRAKESGNTIQFYASTMSVRVAERFALGNEMRHAIERKEFRLHYQPRVSLATGEITCVEALLRWEHPKRGLVSPAEFIPVLEETGLIGTVGDWVLLEACTQVRAWHDQGISSARVAVNLSWRQFQQQHLDRRIQEILAETRLPADCLELELTESLIMSDAERSIAALRRLKDMNVRLAVDDFGIGYSSLSYLKRLPIDIVKIDKSFVDGVTDNREDEAIVTAIVAMAHTLWMTAIAEGVETYDQYDLLRARQCDEIQGYYFSRPLPPADMGQLFVKTNPS